VVDTVFTRHAPRVDEAIASLAAHDAGAAHTELTSYLGIGPCQEGQIGASPALADRAQASFDLGLALFRIGARYGSRFGEDPGRGKEDPRLLAQRSAEVSCALSVVQQIVARRNLPIELRAEAYYLLGNLDFLRHEYKAAVAGYDHALELIPGDDDEHANSVGRDAAHNRALALRLAEENKPEPPKHPDAGPPEQGDGGAPPDKPPPHSDAGKNDNSDSKDKDSENKDSKDKDSENKDQNQDQKQPDDQKQDPEQQADNQQQNQAPQPPPESQQKKEAPAPQPQPMSLSQDDKALDQLERAPTVQQEQARAARGRMRRVVEDK
jgi:hypothetical protein